MVSALVDRTCVRIASTLGLAILVIGLPEALAQSATQTSPIEVPAVAVTASPIVKPRRAALRAQTAGQAQPALPAPAAASVESLPAVPEPFVFAGDAFVPLTVVTGRDILASSGPTITDMLAQKPGILGSTFSPGSNRPVIRGLETYRVRVQENGVGTHDVSALSEDHGVPIDPFAATRIEVIRGPATLRYGSQGIGGVVAIENNRVPTTVPPLGVEGEIKGGVTSVDNGADGAFSVTAGAGNFALHADGFSRRTSGYNTPQGRQANTFVEADGASIGASYVWAHGYFGVAYLRYESLYGIPGEEAATARPRIDLAQDKVISKGEWRVRDYGIEAIRTWFGGSRYGHDEVVFDDVDGVDIVGTRFENREYEARAEIQRRIIATPVGELVGAVGVQWGRKRTSGFGVAELVDGLLDPAARSQSVAGFLFEELQIGSRLRLQAAGRIEGTDAEGTGVADPIAAPDPQRFNRSFTPVSGSIGLLYGLPFEVVARLSAQHTERAPDIGELYSKGVHEATGTFEIGNPGLAVEKADTIEFGLKRAEGGLRFDASVYHAIYDGFIFKSFTGRQCDDVLASCGVSAELDELVFAQRDATFTGAEIGAELDIATFGRGVWGVSGQYDVVRARFEGGAKVPRISPQRIGGGLYYRDPNWLMRIATLTALRQDDVSALDARDTPTNGYTLLNAEVSYTFTSSFDGAPPTLTTIGLKGENLLDDDVRNHVSFKKDEVLQPGRTVRLFGSIKLN